MSEIKVPEHGKVFKLDARNKKHAEALIRLIKLNNNAAIQMTFIFGKVELTSEICCIQCWKDIALQYRDLSDIMLEILEL